MSNNNTTMTSGTVQVRKKPLGLRIWNNRGHYIMFVPVFIFVLILNYWPMLGIRYAFMEYKAGGTPHGQVLHILKECLAQLPFGPRFAIHWC